VNGVYTVDVLRRKLRLPTAAIETDTQGSAALLVAGEYAFADLTAQVGAWYEPEMPPGDEIPIRAGQEPAPRIHSSEVHLLMIDPRPSYLLTFDIRLVSVANGEVAECRSDPPVRH
jgi:hypothetical protein